MLEVIYIYCIWNTVQWFAIVNLFLSFHSVMYLGNLKLAFLGAFTLRNLQIQQNMAFSSSKLIVKHVPACHVCYHRPPWIFQARQNSPCTQGCSGYSPCSFVWATSVLAYCMIAHSIFQSVSPPLPLKLPCHVSVFGIVPQQKDRNKPLDTEVALPTWFQGE